MMSANDLAEARSHPHLVCRLPVQGYGVVEFQMSQERIVHLMDAGGRAATAWYREWKHLDALGGAA